VIARPRFFLESLWIVYFFLWLKVHTKPRDFLPKVFIICITLERGLKVLKDRSFPLAFSSLFLLNEFFVFLGYWED